MEYYYVDINNNSQGPFTQYDLMKIINEDTVVWREGIEWQKASEVMELKKFFPEAVEKLVIKEKIVKVQVPNQNNDKTTDTVIQASLYRSKDSKIFFGFCGGLAHKYNTNVLLIRVVVFFSFLFWIGWLYFLTFLLPAFKTKEN